MKGKAALGQESWLSFDQDNLVGCMEEGGKWRRVILRFHEFQGRRVPFIPVWAVKQWCDLMEEPEAFQNTVDSVTETIMKMAKRNL